MQEQASSVKESLIANTSGSAARNERKTRVPTIPLTKHYREAAEGMLRLVENGTMQERQEGGATVIEVIGEWRAADPEEGAMWGGHMKFAFKDNEAKSEEERTVRDFLAQQVPRLAAYMGSKTLLTVYKQEERSEAWKDVTSQFALKANKYGY